MDRLPVFEDPDFRVRHISASKPFRLKLEPTRSAAGFEARRPEIHVPKPVKAKKSPAFRGASFYQYSGTDVIDRMLVPVVV